MSIFVRVMDKQRAARKAMDSDPPQVAKFGAEQPGEHERDESAARLAMLDSTGLDTGETIKEAVHLAMERLRQRGMLVPGAIGGTPLLADEYRRIKRPLLVNAFGEASPEVQRGNLIMVTSSLAGEGKTTTAINLALAVAQERDHTVLLVDCDVTTQDLSRILDLRGRQGLVDVLENDGLDLAEALVRTDVPDLVVLPAGSRHDYVTELLASKRMSSLVDEMARRYSDRVIIFDGPPLLSAPQAQVLAGLVGQIALVVQADKTPQTIVEEAVETLGEDKAIGLILNKSERTFQRYSYSYGGDQGR